MTSLPAPGLHQPPPTDQIAQTRLARRRRQYRVRSLMMAIAVAAVWFWFLRLPGAWLVVSGPLVALGTVLGILLGAMALGWLGFGLFALVDCLVGWARRTPYKPGPVDDWWA